MPGGKKAVQVTGTGGEFAHWAAVDVAGGVYTDWTASTDLPQWKPFDYLPESEQALRVVGDTMSSDDLSTGNLLVVTASGRTYQSRGVTFNAPWHRIFNPQTTAVPIAHISEKVDEDNGDFVTREYQLPDLDPGERVTVHLTGKVTRPAVKPDGSGGITVGNQDWETYDETLRSKPYLGVPALPEWDVSNPLAFGQWTGNETCTATRDWVVPGDQAGQVWASIPPFDAKTGSIAGYLWWDQLGTGIMADPLQDNVFLADQAVELWRGTPFDPTSERWVTTTDEDGSALTLPSEETISCTAKLPPMSAGEIHRDIFTVEGKGDDSGTPVTASDEWSATVAGDASWTLTKTAQPLDGEMFPGGTITYYLMVANTGDMDLDGLKLTDDLSGVLWDEDGNRIADVDQDTLPVGAELTVDEGVEGGANPTATVTFTVDGLRAGFGDTVSFKVNVRPNAFGQVLVNDATGTLPDFYPNGEAIGPTALDPEQCYPSWFTETNENGNLLHAKGTSPCGATTYTAPSLTLPNSGGRWNGAFLLTALGLFGISAAALAVRRRKIARKLSADN